MTMMTACGDDDDAHIEHAANVALDILCYAMLSTCWSAVSVPMFAMRFAKRASG